jgi:hypothetical protein
MMKENAATFISTVTTRNAIFTSIVILKSRTLTMITVIMETIKAPASINAGKILPRLKPNNHCH